MFGVGRYYQNEKRMTRLQERMGGNKRDSAAGYDEVQTKDTSLHL